MKIAIATEGKEVNAQLSQKGGRAPYYLIFEDGSFLEAIKNPFATGAGGAGFSVAYILADKEVNIFIAGHIGGNMEMALNEKNIKFIEKNDSKTANDIIKEIAD